MICIIKKSRFDQNPIRQLNFTVRMSPFSYKGILLVNKPFVISRQNNLYKLNLKAKC